MAKILFLMWPEKGHLNSSLKIAKTLKSRGHTVVYLQPFEFEEYVRDQGFDFTPFFPQLFPKGRPIHQNHSVPLHEELPLFFGQVAARQQRTALDLLKEGVNNILRTVEPDLLIMDSWITRAMLPAMPPRRPPCILVNPTLIDPYDQMTLPYVSSLTTLILCPEEFDLPHTPKSPRYQYVEAACDVDRKEKPGFPWDRIEESKKLVYCALGSQSHWSPEGADPATKHQNVREFLQTVISALSDRTDCQLVMAMGHYVRAEEFDSVPSNAVLVNEAPQLAILKKAYLAITHGGLNTVKECIFFGVPMIVFPIIGDQMGNAVRVAFHRIGVAGDMKTATAESIRSQLGELESDPGFKTTAVTMMEAFHKAEREQRAVALIEQCLAGKLAVPHAPGAGPGTR